MMHSSEGFDGDVEIERESFRPGSRLADVGFERGGVVGLPAARRQPSAEHEIIGPLENADLVGTELTLAIHETVLPAIDSTPGPSPYLKQLIREGRLGMKSGEGFRTWTPEQQAQLRAKVLRHLKAMNAAESC